MLVLSSHCSNVEYSASGSTGLAMCAFIPAARQRTRSSAKALAVMARIGIVFRIVNWSDPTQFDLAARGSFGNARMVESGFEVEFRSLSQRLNQPTGRTYQRTCDAKLGDARCKFVITPVSVTVVAVSGNIVTIGATSEPNDWFSLGKLVDATGAEHKIKTHSGTRILLWETPVLPPGVGTTVVLTPGCRQTIEVCNAKFNNFANFRGFPHVPGNDAQMSYPIRGREDYNGGSLFK